MKSIQRKIILVLALMVVAIIIRIEAAGESLLKVDVKGSGKTHMILIPGLTCPGAVWDETVTRFADQFTFHVISLPGFAGEAPIETNDYLATMRDRIINYIRTQKLPRPILMGHSLGGFISLWIASVEPELVGRIIVVDALPFLPAIQDPGATPESMKVQAEATKKMMASATPAQVKSSQSYYLTSMVTPPEKMELISQWGLDSHQPTVAQAMYELQTTDLRNLLGTIKTSTMVMGAWIAYKQYGVTHESTLTNFSSQYRELSGVDIRIADNSKHFIMYDDPEWFYTQVESFLTLD